MEYASNGKGNLGVTLGAIGTGLGILNGGAGLLGGMMNAGCNTNCGCSENQWVNRYELTMAHELSAKDGEIALLKADKYTDQKIVEAYTDLQRQISAVAAEMRANKEEQYQVNLNQAVYNGTNTATISCLQQQVAALQALTKLVVPNDSVCPGWGNVTVSPAAAAAATASK